MNNRTLTLLAALTAACYMSEKQKARVALRAPCKSSEDRLQDLQLAFMAQGAADYYGYRLRPWWHHFWRKHTKGESNG